MLPYNKIVFVCESNSAVSILAEAIMNHLQKNMPAEKRITAISRGLVVLFSEPINPKVVKVLEKNNIVIFRENTREFSLDDITPETLIVTMNSKEKRSMEENYPGLMNLYQLRDFSGEGGEISEIHGGTEEDYEKLYEHLDLMIKLMIEKIWPKES